MRGIVMMKRNATKHLQSQGHTIGRLRSGRPPFKNHYKARCKKCRYIMSVRRENHMWVVDTPPGQCEGVL